MDINLLVVANFMVLLECILFDLFYSVAFGGIDI